MVSPVNYSLWKLASKPVKNNGLIALIRLQLLKVPWSEWGQQQSEDIFP